MRIKRLEIKGFKSFPDKTVLEFGPGVTAIVGPNGCGKSNILEALRWVMGEQKAKTFRSRKMDEVIFGGAETRKPVGMAEVRLVLAESPGTAPAVADYDEIMVTRRLFRDGESQYEINNVASRLADVVDFFLDTGVGRNSYAIIEQGRVDMITASKAEDRRAFIEEAAGVNKYKSRRESACKSLEATKLNLSRISDITAEVRRQSASLRRQARLAERRSLLESELREVELSLFAFQAHQLNSEHNILRAQIEGNTAKALAIEETIASEVLLMDDLSIGISQLRQESARIRERRHETELALASLRARMDSCRGARERIRHLENSGEREASLLHASLDESTSRETRLRSDLADAETERNVVRDRLSSSLTEDEAHESSIKSRRSEVDHLREALFLQRRKAAEAAHRIEAAEKRLADLRSARATTEAEWSALTARVEIMTAELSPMEEEHERINGQIAQTREKSHALSKKRAALQSDRTRAIDELMQIERELTNNTARRESIETMLKSFRSHGQAVGSVMSHDQVRAVDPKLVPLTDIFRVSRGFEKALSAALEPHGQCVATRDSRSALEIARIIKELPVGRVTLFPLDGPCAPLPESPAPPPGSLSLAKKVEVCSGLERLRDVLLRNVVITDNLAQAHETQRSAVSAFDVVTRDGDRVSPLGAVITGGAGPTGVEVFVQRSRIEELRAAGDAHERLRERRSDALRNVETDLEAVESLHTAALNEREQLQHRSAKLLKEIAERRAFIDASATRVSTLRRDQERIVAEIEALSKQVPHAKRDEATALSEERETRARLNRATSELELAEGALRGRASVQADLRVHSARIDSRIESLRKDLHSARATISHASARLTALEEQKRRLAEESARRESEAGRLSTEERGLRSALGELSRSAAHIDDDRCKREVRLAGIRSEIDRARIDATSLRSAAHAAELEAAQHAQALASLIEKATERYAVNPLTIAPPAVPPERDQVIALRSQLAAIGEVNPGAVSESRRVEERLSFLVNQEQDLESAVDSLHATILRMDQETTNRFQRAFDAINTRFQEIFPFLFRGGSARLELTEPDHLLDTGVEILASPPGKKVRNMDLLSGGEKALTAVALMFAMFLTRPSPFCLLDEVDAPLDESNIVRFGQMIAKLSVDTQFLIVTHNKRSMETADILYGVTMPEPGVSSVVSVKFPDSGSAAN